MKVKKFIVAAVLLAMNAIGITSANAGTYDYYTEGWPMGSACTVGKTLTFTMPEGGEVYCKLSGVNFGGEYTFSVNGTDVCGEFVYTYSYTDSWSGGSDTYIECNDSVWYSDTEEGKMPYVLYVDSECWDYVSLDSDDKPYKPKAYYLHVYGEEGSVITITSSKGIVTPPKAGTLTVNVRGADATWSLKGLSGAYTNGQSIAITGTQTVTFPTVKGLTKPADRKVEPKEDGELIEVTGVYGVSMTIKGTGATAEYEGEEHTGSFTVVPGDTVTLRASEDVVGQVFQCWTPSKSYDFGDGYAAASNETTIVMPAAALTMTATYLKATEVAYMTMYATAEPVVIDEETTIEPAQGDLLWSTDGKTWYSCGVKILVKKGSYTVQWKSASGTWVGPAKQKVTLSAGQDYSNADSPATFTFATVLKVVPAVYADGDIAESSLGGTVTAKPADGLIAAGGTAVTLTAKANKGYAFVGWQTEKELNESGFSPFGSATYKETLTSAMLIDYLNRDDYQAHFYAVFRPISDYTEESVSKAFQSIVVGGRSIKPTYDEEGLQGSVEVKVGLNCSVSINLDCVAKAKPLVFKVSGKLPNGLRLDAANSLISGMPTVSGTYPVTLTATDPAGHVCTLAMTIVVKSVFEPVVGDWRALLTDGDGIYAGLLEMSITEKGKVSAKIIAASGTTSIAPTVTWTQDEEDPDAQGSFSIEYVKKTGNEKSGSLLNFEFVTNKVEFLSQTWNSVGTSEVLLSGSPRRAESNWFTNEDFAAIFLNKYYTVSLTAEDGDIVSGYRTPMELEAPGYLTLTTDKKGAVKVVGCLADGEKVSASTILLPSSDGISASAMVFIVPSNYKKKGAVALQLDFDSSGNVTSSVSSWVTPPLLDPITGYEPEEGDEFFMPGLLSLSAKGAVYSKLDDLTGYYLSLTVEAGSVSPTLEFSYTDGEKNKIYDKAVVAIESYRLDSTMLAGGKGGKITVAKSPLPWKDSNGEWHYDETKEDKYGETQEITNPGSLTIAFKSATGIFSGKFNLFFDYEVPQFKNGEEIDPKLEHKSVSCSYEGVVIGGADGEYGIGSALYSGKYTYEYTTTVRGVEKSATKTYTRKCALPVNWSLEAGE